jgi:hypothetical protein
MHVDGKRVLKSRISKLKKFLTKQKESADKKGKDTTSSAEFAVIGCGMAYLLTTVIIKPLLTVAFNRLSQF